MKDPHSSGVQSNEPNIIEEKDGDQVLKQFIRGNLLGKGQFSRVYEIKDTTSNEVFACKTVSKLNLTRNRQKLMLKSETSIHQQLQHYHIVKFVHIFEDSENVYILLELWRAGTLAELVRRRKRLVELEVRYYLIQLIYALQHLQSHRVIHRDMKIGNLFIDENMQLKVGDFGLAAQLDHEGQRKQDVCGTANYVAPEVLNSKGYGMEVDIWALGVIIYTLLVGRTPFGTTEVKTTYRKIKQNSYEFPDSIKISQNAKDLIKRILNPDPNKRPTLEQILADDFFTSDIGIPEQLPTSCLALPPPNAFLKRYDPQADADLGLVPNLEIAEKRRNFTEMPCKSLGQLETIFENEFDEDQWISQDQTPKNRRLKSPKTYAQTERDRFPASAPSKPDPSKINPHQPIAIRINRPTTPVKQRARTPDNRSKTMFNRISSPPPGSSKTMFNRVSSPTQETRAKTPMDRVSSPAQSRKKTSKASSPIPTQRAQTFLTRQSSPNNIVKSASSLEKPKSLKRIKTPENRLNKTPEKRQQKALTTRAKATTSDSRMKTKSMLPKEPAKRINRPPREPPADLRTDWPRQVAYIVKQIDYTSKYGLGYYLSNMITGVSFNDGSKMLLYPDEVTYCYYAKNSDEPEFIQNIDEYPDFLYKKLMLLSRFHSYLTGQSSFAYSSQNTTGRSSVTPRTESPARIEDYENELLIFNPDMPLFADSAPTEQNLAALNTGNAPILDPQSDLVYIEKWVKQKQATLFRLSNDIIQVIFQDKTEVILWAELRIIEYVNKLGQRFTYRQSAALENSNTDLAIRIKFAKDMINHMLSEQNKPPVSNTTRTRARRK